MSHEDTQRRVERLEKWALINTVVLITIAPDAIISFLESVIELF